MPYAFHCKICDYYEIGPKPLYSFGRAVEIHLNEKHKESTIKEKPSLLDHNHDLILHYPSVTDHEQDNEFQPRMKKYSEDVYSIVLISHRLHTYLKNAPEWSKDYQKTLKTYLVEWFNE
jgi:hypothetical protein